MNWKPWLTRAFLAIAVAAVLVHLLQRARSAEAEVARLKIVQKAEEAGFSVEYAKQRVTFEREVEAAVNASAPLRAEVLRLESLLRVRPVRIVKASTGPVLVEAPPSPPAVPPSVGSGPCPPPPACLLAPGDTGEARVTEIDFEATAQVRIVVGEVVCYRVKPEPELRLFGGTFRHEATEVSVRENSSAAPSKAGWGFGLTGVAGKFGWAAGPAVSPPPLQVWRLQGEATVGLALGPTGEVAATATAVARIR